MNDNEFKTSLTEFKTSLTEKQKLMILSGSVGLALAATSTAQPAHAVTASTDPVADITTQITSLGTLAGLAVGLALIVFGAIHAFKVARNALHSGGA